MIQRIKIKGLHKKQYKIWNEIINTPASETNFHVLRAGRQSGKTFLILRLALYFALNHDGCEVAFVSAYSRQYRRNWREFLNICPPKSIREIIKGDNLIIFDNGSSIQFGQAANPDSIVGPSYDYLICDEAALYPPRALDIITPTVDAKPNAKVIISSTPRGKNTFYEYCKQGMDEDEPMVKHYRMSYLDNVHPDGRPIFNKKIIKLKKKIMIDTLFKSEYLAEFHFGNSMVFHNFTQYQKIPVFLEDPVPGDSYYGAIDPAGAGEDSTILVILNQKGEVVLIYESSYNDIEKQAYELLDIIKRFKCITKIEKNGIGQGLLNFMSNRSELVSSFNTYNSIKHKLVLMTNNALAHGELILPTIDCYFKLDSEMSSYKAKRLDSGRIKYEHEKGFHDDTVDALMMALYTLELYRRGSGADISTGAPEKRESEGPSPEELRNYLSGDYEEEYNY